jgi:hypothetical protein
MKKIFIFALTSVLAFSLAACNTDGKGGNAVPAPENGLSPEQVAANAVWSVYPDAKDLRYIGEDVVDHPDYGLTEVYRFDVLLPDDTLLPCAVSKVDGTVIPYSGEAPGPALDADALHGLITKIEAREIIEEPEFSFLDGNPELMNMIRTYNELTPVYYDFFLDMAIDTITWVTVTGVGDGTDYSGEWNTPPYYPFTPEAIEEAALRIASLSLYEDCTQRFLDDPLLYPLLEKEAGGSAGMWAYWWHTFYLENRDMTTEVEEYFELVEGIVGALRGYMA